MLIRDVAERDLPAVFDIYNREIRESVAVLGTVEFDDAAARAWFADRQDPRHPGLVAEVAGELLGVAWCSAWSPKRGYARSAEVSVYVRRDRHRQGIGRSLLTELQRRARNGGVCVLLARMESSQQASKRLHESLGFVPVGRMHRVGEKLGRVLDIDLYECQLAP